MRYSKSPVPASNLDSNPQKLWPYTRPNDKDDTIFFIRAVYAFHHISNWQCDQNRSWLQRERYKTQWNRDMNLRNNHLYTWVLLIGRVFTVCNLTSLQKLVLKITLNNTSKNKCLTPVCGKLVSSQTWTAVLTALRVLLSSRNKFKFAWANIKQVNSNNSNASSIENRQVSSSKAKVAWIDISVAPTRGGVLPYMGYIGMCRGIGYGFWM